MTRKKALSGLSATSHAFLNLGVMGRYTGAVVVAVLVVAAVAAVAEEGAAAMLGGRGGNKRKLRKKKGSKRGRQRVRSLRYLLTLVLLEVCLLVGLFMGTLLVIVNYSSSGCSLLILSTTI